MTISLVVACSLAYEHHLDGYLAAVDVLSVRPDEIVVVSDGVKPIIDCTLVTTDEAWNLGHWYNLGFTAATSEWVVWTGVDDRLRPTALDQVANCRADVLAFGLQYTTGQRWMPGAPTADQVLAVDENLIPCGSPVRRDLWQGVPFQPEFYPLDDWAFWVGCAAQGAQFATTHVIDVDYDYGPDHINPPKEPTRTRIAEWAKGLT